MNKLKQLLRRFYFAATRQDKLMHFTAGFFIYLFLIVLGVPDYLSLGIVAIIALFKEVVYDGLMKKGTTELLDMLITIVPAFILYIIF